MDSACLISTSIIKGSFVIPSSFLAMIDPKSTEALLMSYNMTQLHDPILLSLSIVFVNLCMFPLNIIGKVLRKLFAISKALFYIIFFYIIGPHENWLSMVMQIESNLSKTNVLLVGMLIFWTKSYFLAFKKVIYSFSLKH